MLNPPSILLFGKVGQLGWELRRTLSVLGCLRCVDFPEVDLAEPDTFRRVIRETKPRLVINAAAYTAVDKAESEPQVAMQVNGIAPGVMAEEAKRLDALLLHYSTDYVFDGQKGTPYAEDDIPMPLGAYGESKLAGERALQQVDPNYLILRLCWVYGLRGHNFMLTIMRLAREREKLRVVCDQLGSPTWSRLIAEASTAIVARLLSTPDWHPYQGIYHMACSGQSSWHGFAESILRLARLPNQKCSQVEAIATSEYPTPAKRPKYSVLNCAKLANTFGIALPPWEEALQLALDTNQ